MKPIVAIIDRVMSRRRTRLRILYALFLAHEATPDTAVAESALARRLALDAGDLADALAFLEAGGYVRREAAAVRLRHAGLASVESALVRLDREVGEFPSLRSVLNSELGLGPEPTPTRPATDAAEDASPT